jgi:hypothetical protein
MIIDMIDKKECMFMYVLSEDRATYQTWSCW